MIEKVANKLLTPVAAKKGDVSTTSGGGQAIDSDKMDILTFDPDTFITTLPENKTYKKWEAPKERCKDMRTGLSNLEKEVWKALHQPIISEEEELTMNHKIDTFKQAVENSSPNFPGINKISYQGSNDISTYINMYNVGESNVKYSYETMKDYMKELVSTVATSLKTPGSSENEKVRRGVLSIWKTPVDKIVKDDLDHIKESLATMNTNAERINAEGNTIVTEGHMGFNTLKVSRKEDEPDNSSAVIFAVMAYAAAEAARKALENLKSPPPSTPSK